MRIGNLAPSGRCNSVVRKVVFVALVALALPVVAGAKLQGDLWMCGASGCRVVDKHRGHDIWPVVADLSHGVKTGPPPPGPFYRLTVLQLDSSGRPSPALESLPLYFVRSGAVARTDDGSVGAAWTRLWVTPARIAQAARELRPFPSPRLVKVVVGDRRVAKGPNSYLLLFRVPGPDEAIPDPAGPPPQPGATREIAAYARRVERHWIRVYLSSERESPWSDGRTALWVGRKLDLVSRDGEIVRIPHELAERVRRGESLG
jgi:hypothetical protein